MLRLSNGSIYLVLAVLAILIRCAAVAVVATAARCALASGAAGRMRQNETRAGPARMIHYRAASGPVSSSLLSYSLLFSSAAESDTLLLLWTPHLRYPT